MEPSNFEAWLTGVAQLSSLQRKIVFRVLALAEAADPSEEEAPSSPPVEKPTEKGLASRDGKNSGAAVVVQESRHNCDLFNQIARQRIARSGCPHCGSAEIRLWGRANGLPRYRCSACRKTFNPFTATPVAGLHKKDRWLDQACALIEGETLAKAAERCRIDPSTAFRWRHRFLAALDFDKPKRLSGIVEADETFILESFKGRRGGLPRPARKRGGKAAKRGLSAEQIPVIVARDRSGATFDAVLPRLDAASLKEALGEVIPPATDLCCDGGRAIAAFAKRAKLKLHVLPAPGNPRPEEPEFHINNVNAYHGRLKEWMRRFHGVATDNLQTYLNWRRTLESLEQSSKAEPWIKAAAGVGQYQHNSQ